MVFSERTLRSKLTEQAYTKWLGESFFAKKQPSDSWNPATGTCGSHAIFVSETLGFPVKDFGNKRLVTASTIPHILNFLDKGHLVEYFHDYKDRRTFMNLPKDNRYGNHVVSIIKGGSHYFVTQGFLHAYRHSLIAYSRDEIKTMLHRIVDELCDYDNNKHWRDINFPLYKEYFRTDFFMFPKRKVLPNRLVHGVVLTYDTHSPK
jgi:hypothetical protein